MLNVTLSILSLLLCLANLCLSLPPFEAPIGAHVEVSKAILDTYKVKEFRYFYLDFDGTLYHSGMQNSELQGLREDLEALAANPRVQVWIVSARPVGWLGKRLEGAKNVKLSGEHALFTSETGSEDLARTNEFTLLMDKIVDDVFIMFEKEGKIFPPAVRKNIKRFGGLGTYTLILEHLKDPNEINLFKARLKEKVDHSRHALESQDQVIKNLVVSLDNSVITVKPEGRTKGFFVQQQMNLIEEKSNVFGLSMGDQEPDETMHTVMNKYGFHSVHVGKKNEKAQYTIKDDAEGRKLIKLLADYERSIKPQNLENLETP